MWYSMQFNHCLKDVAKSVTDVVALHNDQLHIGGIPVCVCVCVCARVCVRVCVRACVGVG